MHVLRTTKFKRTFIGSFLAFLLASTLILVPSRAEALAIYLQAWESKYLTHGTNLGACFQCNICHASATVTTAANVQNYGNAWLAQWKVLEPGRVTDQAIDAQAQQAWTNLEPADSDGDGSTNVTEIMSESNPNVSLSVPGHSGCSAPSSTGSSSLSSVSPSGVNANANALASGCGMINRVNRGGPGDQDADPTSVAVQMCLLLSPLILLAALRSQVSKV